ncbi:MAG: hypothetical protein ACPLZE_03765 [Candidatus Bipolaricaulaceae bacterium]
MKKLGLVFLFFGAVLAWAQPEEVRDLGFANKPFNPGDVGLVMRALVRDNDAANTDPIYFARVIVENLGTAKAEDIDWVEVRMEVSCGKKVLLAWGKGFPLQEVLLARDPEERMIPDDGEAYLEVWVKATEGITEGRTIQPKITLWWAEGDQGGALEVVDGAAEKLVVAGSFAARALAGPEGGNLNPGDRFPVAEFEVQDTADVNPWGLDVVKVRLDAPKDLVWLLDNGIKKVEIPAGRDYALPEPLFAALDEGKGKLTLWVAVPENFRPAEPVTVTPTLTLTLRENKFSQVFKLVDPVADRVLAAGLEILAVNVPQAGTVLSQFTGRLPYSILTVGDQDRNATPVRLGSLTLRPLGTLTEVGSVEIVDQGGRLVGYAKGLDKPVPLLSPDGKPLLLPDDATWTLNITLTLPSQIPLGASLLLSHETAVEEALPPDWLFRSDALTKFQGTQVATPKEAVFFGKPTLKLSKVEDKAVLSTDGETIGFISGRLKVEPLQFLEVSAEALAGYRLSTKLLEDGLSFTLEIKKAETKAGDFIAFTPRLKPVRVPAKEMTVSLDLAVDKVVDWAGISLPFAVGPTKATFSFTVPQIGILPTPERKDAAILHADMPLGSLKAYLYFDPQAPVELKGVQGLDPYTAAVVSEEKPEPGRVLLSLALAEGKEPAAGALVQLLFTKKVEREVRLPLRLEVLEARDAKGDPIPFFLEPEALELAF